jgi:hypothetical protein
VLWTSLQGVSRGLAQQGVWRVVGLWHRGGSEGVLQLSGGVARGRVTCPFNELIDICEWGLRASGGVEGVGLLVKELLCVMFNLYTMCRGTCK